MIYYQQTYAHNRQTYFNIYDVFFSQCSHQHVPASNAAIFRVILLQKYKRTNLVNCVTITP
jgi:hypothetical protein